MTRLKLYPQTDNYWKDYNISMDTSISNNFATSSFRFAHTLIPVSFKEILYSIYHRVFLIINNFKFIRE